MTPREKILRDALKKAMTCLDDVRDWHTPESRESLIVRVLNEVEILRVKADAVKDGPSEEDMERLKEILGQHRAVKKYTDTENLRGVAYELINDLNWVGDKLKQYMDIKTCKL